MVLCDANGEKVVCGINDAVNGAFKVILVLSTSFKGFC